MTPDDLRALADAIVYRDSLAIARAADYLRACADAEPVARIYTDGWQLVPVKPTQAMIAAADDAYSRGYSGTATAHPATVYIKMLAAAPATPQPCWCHKCNAGRLVNGIPFAMTQMIACPICGNKRCPHASDHALACTASNDPIAVPAAPQAEPKRPVIEVRLDPHDGYWRVALCVGVQEFEFADTWNSQNGAESYANRLRTALGIGDSDADR